MNEAPTLSIVIGSQNARASIRQCLTALEGEHDDHTPEILVVDNSTDGTAEIVRADFPQVKLIVAPADALMPELWETGIRQSAGEIVALTTSHFVPEPDWVKRMLRAHRSAYTAIGGAIENDPRGDLTDWAVYFGRYSAFIPPFAAAEAADIAGDNASYKRAAIDRYPDARRNGFWEPMVHDEMRRDGMKLLLDPSIVVRHTKSFTATGFIAQRFWHGRQYGSARAARAAAIKRAMYLLLSPVVPGLLFFRIARRVFAKKRHVAKFLLSSPILFLFLLSWSAGEASGSLWIAPRGHERSRIA